MRKIENFVFNHLNNSSEYGEPKLLHSYILCVANVFNHLSGKVDPVWVMGSSAFAFRIFVEETLCPSAMSMFDFSSILPEAIKQSGRRCIYISRMLDEKELEQKKRKEAHSAILKEINRNIPAVVWDIHNAEWGIIIGYDNDGKNYFCIDHKGENKILPYNKLGMNGIDLLSVTIPGKRNEKPKSTIITNSLIAAVRHADGKEWIDERPRYQNGLAGYDLWLKIFERWAWLIESGKIEKAEIDIISRARYYAEYYFYARTYACRYLKLIAGSNVYLNNAYDSYLKVSENLKQLWEYFINGNNPRSDDLLLLSGSLRSAKESEEEGIEYIRKYLNQLNLNK